MDKEFKSRVRLDLFDPGLGLDRGRSTFIEAVWYIIKIMFFLTPFPWPVSIKTRLLRMFGSKIGKGVIIKPRVNIHFPWKLEIGDYTWIGEEVFILNFEKVTIGSNVCISQRAFLCGGNHDYKDIAFSYKNGTIDIGDGAWVGAQSFIAPNIKIGVDTVVSSCSMVNKSLPDNYICSGVPCVPVKKRWNK